MRAGPCRSSNAHATMPPLFRLLMVVSLAVATISPSCERPGEDSAPMTDERSQFERARLVEDSVIPNGVSDRRVLAAMRRVPRHRFVPEGYASRAYLDEPLPIGHGQTISQPSLVALMLQSLSLNGREKVLEVGTGSGYQTAILAELVPHVFTIEIIEPLAGQAALMLKELGYLNVTLRVGDGYRGWPEEAPFDAIIVTAAPDHVPEPLLGQLAVDGRMILPVGRDVQHLLLITRTPEGYQRTILAPVRFVPMTGRAEEGLEAP